MTAFRTLVAELSPSLTAFTSSSAAFQAVKTITSSSSSSSTSSTPSPPPPRTLLILDSSFNPPSKAHLSILSSALSPSALSRHPGPYRVLLLLSTQNADKAPSAATFDQRLALMSLLASDLAAAHPSLALDIDVGLTTRPYYTDKSTAITASHSPRYPPGLHHVHLLGYDTLTRFFTPRYYAPAHDPPLSALAPFFDDAGHALRVTLRPDDGYGSVAEQRAFVAGIGAGQLEGQGGRREWAALIEVDEGGAEGVGVSSTRVREAAREARWDVVRELCTPAVAEAVTEEGIYA